MTDRDTTPAERLQAHLDLYLGTFHIPHQLPDGGTLHRFWIDSTPHQATLADLRAVLAEHQAMRERLAGGSYEWAWANHDPYGGTLIHPADDEADARRHLIKTTGRTVVRRLVGDWEAADDA